MARRLVTHYFGTPPRRIVDQTGGLSNFVFVAPHPEGDFVVRISPDPLKLDVFIKEEWAISRVRRIGVPTPEVLAVGSGIISLPHMIARKVNGDNATFHPKRMEILCEMGRYAALINSLPTSGFGHIFDWSDDRRSRNETWAEFLHNELTLEARLDLLGRYRMLPASVLKKLRGILEAAAGRPSTPMLNHGDVRLKNVIVDGEGAIAALIDWEHSLSAPAPAWELSVALHDLSTDEKQVFLQGYGLRDQEVVEIAPVMKALNIINYVPKLEHLVASAHPHRLEQYRTRLSGALDLYSL